MKRIFWVILLGVGLLRGQDKVCYEESILTNGGLNGEVHDQLSVVPMGWENIPQRYVVSEATARGEGTVDLVDESFSGEREGLKTKPMEGISALSAVHFHGKRRVRTQEGIFQKLKVALEVGETYRLSLKQAVIIQDEEINETRGQWKIYFSRTKIPRKTTYKELITEVSEVVINPERYINIGNTSIYIDSEVLWEERVFEFVADKSYMYIYILPFDSDGVANLRMGIDDIVLQKIVDCSKIGEKPILQKVCFKEPNLSGQGKSSHFGITTLKRAGDNGDDNEENDWPMMRKGAWMVLESNTKGMVLTRMSSIEIEDIVNPQEGMITYDTDEKCLKIYNGKDWYCYTKQGCPSN